MRALIIRTDSTYDDISIRKGLSQIKKIVQGDFECITLDDNFSMTMFINETGKLKSLPKNELATKIYRSFFRTTDYIAGDVVIKGMDDEGETCDLTDKQMTELIKLLEG